MAKSKTEQSEKIGKKEDKELSKKQKRSEKRQQTGQKQTSDHPANKAENKI